MSISKYLSNGIPIAEQAHLNGAFEKIKGLHLISFVDDDTARTQDVQRYHHMCVRNGIVGNFAVVTNYLNGENPLTDPNELLSYQDDGFGCLIHAWRQNSNQDPTSPDFHNYFVPQYRDIDKCRANELRGLRDMQDFKFNNYRLWITPNGVYDDEIRDLARFLGMKCLFSFAPADNNYTYNAFADPIDRYHIYRTAFSNTESNKAGTEAVKAQIDALMDDANGGWLIITTHFNEWRELTWDTTTDDKGEIGYSRFNVLAQYAVESGAKIVSLQEGISYIEPMMIN